MGWDRFLSVRTPLSFWGRPIGRRGGGEGLRAQKLVALFTKASPIHLMNLVSVSPHPRSLSQQERGEPPTNAVPARSNTPSPASPVSAYTPMCPEGTEGVFAQRRAPRRSQTYPARTARTSLATTSSPHAVQAT